MTPKTKQLYHEAKHNQEFLDAIYKADKDKAPSYFAPTTAKVFFTATYYGWLVAKGKFNKNNY